MEFNIRNVVKERCKITFEKIVDNNPYFNYETFKNELIKETESILEKIKPRVDLSMTTNENDLHIGFDNSIDIFSLTQSQVNATYLFLIETINYLNENRTLAVITTENKNEHPKMFINNGFRLFEYILNNHVAENRGRINDISFYYWKMYNDNYIIQKPFPFVEWFMNLYDVENFQIKTLETATDRHRPTHYSNALDWFKLQNQ